MFIVNMIHKVTNCLIGFSVSLVVQPCINGVFCATYTSLSVIYTCIFKKSPFQPGFIFVCVITLWQYNCKIVYVLEVLELKGRGGREIIPSLLQGPKPRFLPLLVGTVPLGNSNWLLYFVAKLSYMSGLGAVGIYGALDWTGHRVRSKLGVLPVEF